MGKNTLYMHNLLIVLPDTSLRNMLLKAVYFFVDGKLSLKGFSLQALLRGFRHQLQKSAPSGTNYKLSPYAPGRRSI